MTAGQTNLLKSWEEKEEILSDGGRVMSFTIGGDRHVMAILAAVVDRYQAVTERRRPTLEELEKLVGEKVTLIQAGDNMLGGGILVAQEGKLFTGNRTGRLAIMPKGARSKGYVLKPEEVLDVFPGYDTAQAVELVGKVRSHFPQVRALTQERLKELPTNSETLSLCMFGTYVMPWGKQADALYLASEYWPEDDIVEGVVLLRGENGVSENGSTYGEQLLRQHLMGEVVGFQPVSFAEGIHFCNLTFDEAYEQIMEALASPEETCPECGQPDNCGDCTHERVIA